MDRESFYDTVLTKSERGDVFFRPILMQFAAHQIGKSYRDFYTDHEVLVEANIAGRERFGMDAVGLISDPTREAEAFGARFEYLEEGVPRCTYYPVQTMADVEALPEPDVTASKRTADRIAGVRRFRERLGNDVPLIGWIEGPLAEACDLVGVSEMLVKLATEREFSKALLAKVMPTAKAFAQAQIEAGCDIIGIGDAICSQISPRMYQNLVKPLHAELIDFIHSQGALVKVHICGNITHLLPHLREFDPDIVDLDWMVDMDHAYEVLGPDIIRGGNLDPAGVIEQLPAEAVAAQTRALVAKERGRAFILAGGCEITPLTPPENLLAMREASQA
ncbi:MAG: uroporphyrinogen decarboxylase family protein [Anaerolineae bacterium]|nr:uroporphyrinogen decarboxylase family protein [Anaerolineae bacterium]